MENSVRYVRERFFKGETFIDLEDVARRALVWCREVAGRRLHGTTRRVPLEVFETEEKSQLIPLQAERFETPTWAQCQVHPDHHIRFGQALYSVPTRWIGCRVEVRGDRSLVRIYARGELIKTHERKPPGSRSTDYTDYPEGRAPYARRWPDYYRRRARELGSAAGEFTDQLLGGEFPLEPSASGAKAAAPGRTLRGGPPGRRLSAGSRLRPARRPPPAAHSGTGIGISNRTSAGRRTSVGAPVEISPSAHHFVDDQGGPHADPA